LEFKAGQNLEHIYQELRNCDLNQLTEIRTWFVL